jgi:putative ABC transport system ATP-binding protein
MIEVKNISKVFGKKDTAFTALDNINVTIPDGATVAIVGKSGSGKSTLMHIMSGLDHSTSGSIIFNGRDISHMKPKQADAFRANEMSFVFQAFFVEANRTCIDNVMLPMEIAKTNRRDRVKKAEKALEAVELMDKRDVKAKNLSGGQKQRLAVARSIVNEPKLLFADEPTGNLDTATGDKIINMLFDLNKKMKSNLVIVTHDADLAAKCDMRIHLKDGKVEKIDQPKKGAKQ